jgi:hypothetical protein
MPTGSLTTLSGLLKEMYSQDLLDYIFRFTTGCAFDEKSSHI